MNPEWVRSIRDQCLEGGVPFFFKQWGAWGLHAWGKRAPLKIRGWFHVYNFGMWKTGRWCPGSGEAGAVGMVRYGKKRCGRELDGRKWNQRPEGW